MVIAATWLWVTACNALWGLDQLDYQSSGAGGSAAGGAQGGAGGATSSGGGTGGGGLGGQGGQGGDPYVWCDEPNLIACFEFEGSAVDGSLVQHQGTAVDVSYVPGVVGQAAAFGPNGRVWVAPHATLSPAVVTIELWVRFASLPVSSARMGLFDNPSRFGLFLYANGFRCSANSASIELSGSVPQVNEWTHVACTNDGTTITLFVNGQPTASGASVPLITDPSSQPAAIGSDEPPGDYLNGAIDQFRLFAVVRTAEQIAQAATF